MERVTRTELRETYDQFVRDVHNMTPRDVGRQPLEDRVMSEWMRDEDADHQFKVGFVSGYNAGMYVLLAMMTVEAHRDRD